MLQYYAAGLPLHLRLKSYQRLSDRIRQSRIAAGLTQAKLAAITGMSHNTLNRIDLGRCRVEVMVLF